MRELYLDNNATTRPDPAVIQEMELYFRDIYANPSSVHRAGVEADRALRRARERIARLAGVAESSIVFTSGGTESNNMALKGIAQAYRQRGKHIVTTEIEHPAVLEPLTQLEQRGFEVTRVNPRADGMVTTENVVEAIREDTILVSVMHVNNETGAILPVSEMARRAKEKRPHVLFHSDGVQAFGKIPVQLINIDSYSASAHKLHGPRGVGLLFLSPGTTITPLLAGGGHENGRRSGTENLPAIAGFARAYELAVQAQEASLRTLSSIHDSFVAGLRTLGDVTVITPEDTLPTTINASFYPIPGEVMVNALSEEGIYVSTGAACSNRGKKKSHVLEAMGIAPHIADSSIRFSLSRHTSSQEMERVLETLAKLLPRLRTVAQRMVS